MQQHFNIPNNRRDNIEDLGDICFDNWMINKQINVRTNNRQNSFVPGEYSEIGNLTPQNKTRFAALGPIQNTNIGHPFNDTECVQWTREWSRNYYHLERQLEFVDTLLALQPGHPRYHMREALENYITSSDRIQGMAIAEMNNPRSRMLISMEQIFQEIPETTHSFVVFRVFATPPGPDFAPEGTLQWRGNHRFMSTGLSKTLTSGYLGAFMEPILETSHHIKIIIPPGNKVIPIMNFVKWSANRQDPNWVRQVTSTQFEMILPRYQRLYNVPDAITTCNSGAQCRRGAACNLPHFNTRYSTGRNERLSSSLSSTLEKTRINMLNNILLSPIQHHRRINLDNVVNGFPNAINLQKGPDNFTLNALNETIRNNQYPIHFEDRILKPRIAPFNQINPGNFYNEMPERNIAFRNVMPPDITDMMVLMPRRASRDNQYVSLQNGWYLIYRWGGGAVGYIMSLFNPRLKGFNGDTFWGNYNAILGGGGKNKKDYLEDEKLNYNPFELLNDIGLDISIPIHDKFELILKIKDTLKKDGKDIIIHI